MIQDLMAQGFMAQGFMLGFAGVLLGLIVLTLIIQLITKMKIVGASELAIVSGKGSGGFATLRGGRVFVWPLIHRFYKMDLRPRTTRDAEAQVAGIRAQIEAEQQRIEMLRAKYQAEILIPAEAEKERMSLEAKTQAAALRGPAQPAIDQLKRTVEILQQGGKAALQAYLIENFEKFIQPFAQTLDLFPVKHATVITGAGAFHPPLSGIHPHPIEEEKARLLQQAFGAIATVVPEKTAGTDSGTVAKK